MFGWFKKKKEEPDPFVKHVIESLESNPESWSLHETEEIDHWVQCGDDHPDAKVNHKKDSGERIYEQVKGVMGWWKVPYYERPVMRFVFRLKHEAGTIVVIDHNAANYLGWEIEEPRHAKISDYDSRLLSDAVKKWREHMVLHDLTKLNPEQKLLEEAMEELAEEGL